RGKLDGWQEMIFFDRFSSSTTFSIWQPERMWVLHAITCLRLKVATLPGTEAHGNQESEITTPSRLGGLAAANLEHARSLEVVMLDVFLLKEGLQIQQRSTVLVELLGIRLRPPDSDDERAVRMIIRDEGEQVHKASLVLVSACQLACSFQKLFFLLQLQCAGHHTCKHRDFLR